MNICFDVDGCLIKDGKPIEANIELVRVLAKTHKVYLWSGNGFEYAKDFADEYSLTDCLNGVFNKYNTFIPDIAFDDQEVLLGKLNIKI